MQDFHEPSKNDPRRESIYWKTKESSYNTRPGHSSRPYLDHYKSKESRSDKYGNSYQNQQAIMRETSQASNGSGFYGRRTCEQGPHGNQVQRNFDDENYYNKGQQTGQNQNRNRFVGEDYKKGHGPQTLEKTRYRHVSRQYNSIPTDSRTAVGSKDFTLYNVDNALNKHFPDNESDYIGEGLETGFDEPRADYDTPVARLEPKDTVKHSINFNDRSKLYSNQEDLNDNGRDNPAFIFEFEEGGNKKDGIKDGKNKGNEECLHEYESDYYGNNRQFDVQQKSERNGGHEIIKQSDRKQSNWQHESWGYDGQKITRGHKDSNSDEVLLVDKNNRSWSVKRRHKGYRVTISSPSDVRMSVKTLQRKKLTRPQTELWTGTKTREIMADRLDSVFREVDSDENKLPSNRNMKTKSLRKRIEILHECNDVSAHDFADSLR